MSSTVISISQKDLKKELRARERSMPKIMMRSMRRAAMRGRTLLVKRTPKDLGQAKAGWRISDYVQGSTRASVDLLNDVPYVGVLEHGARPHKVSMEGIAAIHGWVWRNRHLFASLTTDTGRRRGGNAAKKEALGIAFAIAKKIEKEGQKPTYFVRNSMDDLRRIFAEEMGSQIERASKRRATKLMKEGDK